jgi:phosphoribosylformylglycinamidine synthase
VSLGGSEYSVTRHRRLAGRWRPSTLEIERRVQRACAPRWRRGWSRPPTTAAEGGVAVALAESCVTGRDRVGCEATLRGERARTT